MKDTSADAGHDEVGESTLTSIAAASAFNKWMYDTIQPFIKGPVLEIGSGIGNISTFCINSGHKIFLSDLRKEYCDTLVAQFGSSPNLLGVEPIDLVSPTFSETYAAHLGKYQAAYALNVVEHIENDAQAIRNLKKLLSADGTLIILVPAYQWLFSRFDTELGHYRRYTRTQLIDLFEKNGFSVSKSFYFNSVGILGWLLFGKILKRKQIKEGQMKLYNLLVPLIKIADTLILRSFGLSVIAVGTPRKET